jgi:acyl-CoA reductase-like NAD-dependent aldehyde dehydrogenase
MAIGSQVETYPSLIGGEDVEHEQWLHVLHASALLRDEISALRLKRSLDRGLTSQDDSRVAGRVGVTSTAQIAAAGRAARKAQLEWGATDVSERIAFARAVGQRIKRCADVFTDVLIAEGHPRRLANWEVASALEVTSDDTLARYAAQLDERVEVGGRQCRLVRRPDGVVAVHPPHNAAASNSLLALGALIAGNALVVKAPRSAPLGTSWLWRDIVQPVLNDFGAPPGTLNLICAKPNDVLDQWLESDDIDDLLFFGDSTRGISVGASWTARGKKAILELAGNDGVLVWRDAEVPHAVTALSECFYGSAQICMVPKYALVHVDVLDDVVARLIARVRTINPGFPEDDGALLSPVLKSADFETYLEKAIAGGAQLACGGRRLEIDGSVSAVGFFVEPTVIIVDDLTAADSTDAVRRETFFPLLPIVVVDPAKYGSDRHALGACIDFMNRNEYGLRNSAWIRDEDSIDLICKRLTNGGILKINDSHIGQVSGMPTHGGTGLTGGPFGEAHYPILRSTHLQVICIGSAVEPREQLFAGLGPQS